MILKDQQQTTNNNFNNKNFRQSRFEKNKTRKTRNQDSNLNILRNILKNNNNNINNINNTNINDSSNRTSSPSSSSSSTNLQQLSNSNEIDLDGYDDEDDYSKTHSPSTSASSSSSPAPSPNSNNHINEPRSTPYFLISPSSWNLLITISLSAALTLLNKSIYTKFDYPFPFHLLALHFASISITSRLLAKFLRPKELKVYRERVNWSFWFKNVLTVGLTYGSAILFSNVAYLMLSVSFVQMLKAFTPVILVFVTSLLDHRLPPMRTTSVVLTISTGVAIAAYGEIHFVFMGAFFQLLGSLAEVGRLIVTQRLLQDLNVDPIVALSALSPICFTMALILAPFFEGFEPIFLLLPRLGFSMILTSTILALSLNIVVLFLVSSTNALVLTLAGIVKDICLILGSVVFLNSKITSIQIIGYGISAIGLIYFKFSSNSNNSNNNNNKPSFNNSHSRNHSSSSNNFNINVSSTGNGIGSFNNNNDKIKLNRLFSNHERVEGDKNDYEILPLGNGMDDDDETSKRPLKS